jgi:hypothetical protein
MAAVYRMEHYDWTADQAFREMKQYRFGWDFLHPEFKGFVYAYHPGSVQKVTLRRVTAGEMPTTAAAVEPLDRPAAPVAAAAPVGG